MRKFIVSLEFHGSVIQCNLEFIARRKLSEFIFRAMCETFCDVDMKREFPPDWLGPSK